MMKSTIAYLVILAAFTLTVCSIREHSPCQETCEYSRQDCIQLCGDPNKAGFNMKLGGGWEIGSVDSCIKKCNSRFDECIERCKNEEREIEKLK